MRTQLNNFFNPICLLFETCDDSMINPIDGSILVESPAPERKSKRESGNNFGEGEKLWVKLFQRIFELPNGHPTTGESKDKKDKLFDTSPIEIESVLFEKSTERKRNLELGRHVGGKQLKFKLKFNRGFCIEKDHVRIKFQNDQEDQDIEVIFDEQSAEDNLEGKSHKFTVFGKLEETSKNEMIFEKTCPINNVDEQSLILQIKTSTDVGQKAVENVYSYILED